MTEPKTALVLGGGGITGIAWEIGLLAGLAEVGVDLTRAETVVGTSAGSVVGALITTGEDLESLYATQLADATGEAAAKLGLKVGLRFAAYFLAPGDSRTKLRRLGRAAMRTKTVDQTVRVEVIRERLGERAWASDRRLLVTAVDAESGEFTVFDKDAGIDLAGAVASSCAVPLVWPPVSVDGHRYMDGGMRSPANADLPKGAERVVVLAPLTATFSKGSRVENQLARLGSSVRSVVVSPDTAAKRAIGKNVLDPAQRAASARAGREQAAAVLAQVSAVWPARADQ